MLSLSYFFRKRSFVSIKKILKFCLFAFILINILYIFTLKSEFDIITIDDDDYFYRPKIVKENKSINENDGCYASFSSNQKYFDLKDYHNISSNICSKNKDWLSIDQDGIVTYDFKFLNDNDIIINICKYATIEWYQDDFNYKLSDYIEIKNGSKLDNSKEFFYFKCDYEYKQQKWLFSYEYKTLYARIFENKEKINSDSKKQPINIFLLGFDSVSKDYWLNNLPLTSSYLYHNLKSEVLKRYNIVGDGTPANLIPLLCSKNEEDLPNTIKNTEQPTYVDLAYPFVWNNFTKHLNYSSLFAEDWPEIGTFQYRMVGMSKPPTKHYMRPVQLFMENENLDQDCINGRSLLRFNLDYAFDFMNKYKSNGFFGFMFLNYYSHDSLDKLNPMDKEILDFLVRFNNEKSISENTIFITFSDHGPRFGSNRESIRGLLNERNPFFSIYIPKLFKQRYPKHYENFLKNTNQLLTPMDIHKTFLNIISLEKNTDITVKNNYLSANAVSLFDKIGYNRTCEDAKIDKHWCSCLKRTKLILDNYLIQAAQVFINYLNNDILKNHLNKCQKLYLDSILNVYLIDSQLKKSTRKIENQSLNSQFNLLKEPKVKIDYEEYFFQIKTKPNNAIYEVTLTSEMDYSKKLNIKTPNDFVDHIKINKDKISRVNMYGNQSHCIKDDFPDLRKYCYCILL